MFRARIQRSEQVRQASFGADVRRAPICRVDRMYGPGLRMYDLHNHILAGLDDGARNWSQSLAMAQIALQDGIRGVVCTPHWVHGSFDNTRNRVLKAVEQFKEKLEENGIPLQLYPGTELRLDFELANRIASGEVLTLNDTGRYALIEFPDAILPRNMENFFWELQSQDITPILAHPERHMPLMQEPADLYRWVEMGVLVQITAASLLGLFGTEIQEHSVLLLDHRMVHVIATDSHGLQARVPRLSDAFEIAAQIVGRKEAWRLVSENPLRIIHGESLSPREPVQPSRNQAHSVLKKFLSFLGLTPR